VNYEKLSGIWHGIFKYGNAYPEDHRKIVEPFTLDIKFDECNFNGICEDRFSKTYFNSSATVEGSFVPNLISFIKRYPGLLTIDEEFQTVALPDKPSLDIHYTGFYYKGIFSSKARFEGEWIITDYILNDAGQREYSNSGGVWMMSKKV